MYLRGFCGDSRGLVEEELLYTYNYLVCVYEVRSKS